MPLIVDPNLLYLFNYIVEIAIGDWLSFRNSVSWIKLNTRAKFHSFDGRINASFHKLNVSCSAFDIKSSRGAIKQKSNK